MFNNGHCSRVWTESLWSSGFLASDDGSQDPPGTCPDHVQCYILCIGSWAGLGDELTTYLTSVRVDFVSLHSLSFKRTSFMVFSALYVVHAAAEQCSTAPNNFCTVCEAGKITIQGSSNRLQELILFVLNCIFWGSLHHLHSKWNLNITRRSYSQTQQTCISLSIRKLVLESWLTFSEPKSITFEGWNRAGKSGDNWRLLPTVLHNLRRKILQGKCIFFVGNQKIMKFHPDQFSLTQWSRFHVHCANQ